MTDWGNASASRRDTILLPILDVDGFVVANDPTHDAAIARRRNDGLRFRRRKGAGRAPSRQAS